VSRSASGGAALFGEMPALLTSGDALRVRHIENQQLCVPAQLVDGLLPTAGVA
jgi:hypothetical protein